MVIEARKISDSLKKDNNTSNTDADIDKIVHALDAMGYDEAAQYVYGMTYPEWKRLHSKKASDEQMDKFNASKPMWATHDKQLLTKITDQPPSEKLGTKATTATIQGSDQTNKTNSLLSNVCCQDVDEQPVQTSTNNNNNIVGTTSCVNPQPPPKSSSRQLPPYQPPSPPTEELSFSLGVLTVSDRASRGDYETGDLSGPAVLQAVSNVLKRYGNDNIKLSSSTSKAIVPDDTESIQSKLKEWSDTDSNERVDLILTTGGTGFSPRDVTPEATSVLLDKNCEGLLTFCTMECSKIQPLSSLSRGTAGIRNQTFIANLPGNPRGVDEIMPILLPLVLHAVADMKKMSI
jgi:gephyrin